MSGQTNDGRFRELKARCEALPVWGWYGMEVETAAGGRCRLKLAVQPGMINADDQTLHGGVVAALVDEAVDVALQTLYRLGEEIQGRTTVELNLSFLQGVRTPEAYVEARVLRQGRTLVVGDAQVLDAQGVLCASGRATYMVFR